MKHFILIMALLCVLPAAAHAETLAEKRASINRMETETLARLYRNNPDAQREIQNAAGYAVFSNGSLALIWVSGGYGHGIAHDKRNGTSTYMQMASAGVGLGLGAKNFQTVFVFHTPKALYDFVHTGLDMSGHADAAAKVGEKGSAFTGAADVIPGVRVYQMTDSGLLAQAMLQGTKYWPDNELNNNHTNTIQHTQAAPAYPENNTSYNNMNNTGTMNQTGIQPAPVTRSDLNR